MTYNFDVNLTTPHYTIEIDTAANYGYFENNKTGSGGGLWFEGKEILDYDGVSELPKEVEEALKNAGFEEAHWNEEDEGGDDVL